jgi:hypothetical protein
LDKESPLFVAACQLRRVLLVLLFVLVLAEALELTKTGSRDRDPQTPDGASFAVASGALRKE